MNFKRVSSHNPRTHPFPYRIKTALNDFTLLLLNLKPLGKKYEGTENQNTLTKSGNKEVRMKHVQIFVYSPSFPCIPDYLRLHLGQKRDN